MDLISRNMAATLLLPIQYKLFLGTSRCPLNQPAILFHFHHLLNIIFHSLFHNSPSTINSTTMLHLLSQFLTKREPTRSDHHYQESETSHTRTQHGRTFHLSNHAQVSFCKLQFKSRNVFPLSTTPSPPSSNKAPMPALRDNTLFTAKTSIEMRLQAHVATL